MYLFYLVLYVKVALNAKNVISNVCEMSLHSVLYKAFHRPPPLRDSP